MKNIKDNPVGIIKNKLSIILNKILIKPVSTIFTKESTEIIDISLEREALIQRY